MMNENSEQKEKKEENKEEKEVFKKPSEREERDKSRFPSKPKDPKRVAAGKKGAEARIRNAELRKKEAEKLKKENLKIREQSERSPPKQPNDLPQITKDSDTDDDESNVKKRPNSKVDYKYILFSIGIVGLGLFFYNQSNEPEKMIREVILGKEKTSERAERDTPQIPSKKPEKQKKEIDPLEFN